MENNDYGEADPNLAQCIFNGLAKKKRRSLHENQNTLKCEDCYIEMFYRNYETEKREKPAKGLFLKFYNDNHEDNNKSYLFPLLYAHFLLAIILFFSQRLTRRSITRS